MGLALHQSLILVLVSVLDLGLDLALNLVLVPNLHLSTDLVPALALCLGQDLVSFYCYWVWV